MKIRELIPILEKLNPEIELDTVKFIFWELYIIDDMFQLVRYGEHINLNPKSSDDIKRLSEALT